MLIWALISLVEMFWFQCVKSRLWVMVPSLRFGEQLQVKGGETLCSDENRADKCAVRNAVNGSWTVADVQFRGGRQQSHCVQD